MKKNKLDKNKLLTYIFLIGLGIIVFLSLLSYHQDDPVGFGGHYNSLKPRNMFSILGATIAAPLFEKTFGYGSLIFPIILFFILYARYKKMNWGKITEHCVKLLLVGLWGGIFLAVPQAFSADGSFEQYYPSGDFSATILKVLFYYTGSLGTAFILTVSFLLFLLWLLKDISFIITFFSAVKKMVYKITVTVIDGLFFLVRKAGSLRGVKNVREMDEVIIEEEEFWAHEDEKTEIPEKEKNEIDEPEEKEKWELVSYAEAEGVVIEEEYETEDELNEEDEVEIFPPEKPAADNTQLTTIKAEETAVPDEEAPMEFEVEAPHQEKELKIEKFIEHQLKKYEFPSVELLDYNKTNEQKVTREELEFNAQLLVETLSYFNVEAKLIKVMEGPVVTQYQLKPAKGVKISKIVGLQDDLALALKAKGIRIIAPIPGKSAVGVEIPNRNRSIVYLKSIMRSERFVNFKGELPIALGKMINGEIYADDLTQMPHLLLAGATGTGKSVGLNVLIASILYRIPPSDVKFILIDPKRLEFALYEDLKNHYLAYCPELDEYVITEPDNAVLMLQSLIIEMEQRYQMLKELSVRNIKEYNRKIKDGLPKDRKYVYEHKHLPYLIVIIDELADLMLSSAKEVEEPIARLTQKARAAGIHLIVATQRPSVNVITGIIKANFPCRIAYQVPQKIDSKVILDLLGADQLIGKGDMLYKSPAFPKPIRIQTPLIETWEVERVVQHIKKQPHFPPYELKLPVKSDTGNRSGGRLDDFVDPLFNEAKQIVIMHQAGSASLLQRKLRIGYARAASILDQLEEAGIVGPSQGSKAREVYFDRLD